MTFEYTMYSDLKACLAGVDIVVEATSFEKGKLYMECRDKVKWKQHLGGWLPTVGYIYKKPICISTMFATINDKFVLFWHPTSRMVDHTKIDD